MNFQTYTHAEVKIGGQRVAPLVYEATAELTITSEAAARLLDSLDGFQRGLERQRQLCARLERRMCYGGRKGRRAARRLRALVLAAIRGQS